MKGEQITTEKAATLARDVIREVAYPSGFLQGRTEVSLRMLADAVGKKVGHLNNGYQVREVLLGATTVVWEHVRCGLLTPLQTQFSIVAPIEPVFYFTDAGESWLRGTLTANPFAPEYIKALLTKAPVFKGEPALVYTEALKAKSAGLLRASMILLGLSAENMVANVFDEGVKTGKVVDDQAHSRRYAAFAVQADVEAAIQRLEDAKAISKGDTMKWTLAATAYREMRNDCAHDAKYQPNPFEVETGFFAWTHFVTLTNTAWTLIAQ
jgi:hypothetical protein